MIATYEEFIASKRRKHVETGRVATDMHPSLFDFQRATCSWGMRKGRACVFAGTGLGKTYMQVELVRQLSDLRVLVVAPLAVSGQTCQKAAELGIELHPVRSESDASARHAIVNYDRLHLTELESWDAVILDESSILKSHDGKYRKYLQDRFAFTPWRFAFSATPAPNDYMELGTHAEFVGAMTRTEMLAEFFTHDGGETAKWRLKKHGVREFWQWVSGWAACYGKPSDIGFSDDGFELPELNIHTHVVHAPLEATGTLFGPSRVSAMDLHRVGRATSESRVDALTEIVRGEDTEPWLIWCNTNDEHARLLESLPDAVGVKGDDKDTVKEDRLLGFASGKYRVLVTKPSIAGFGMNWQHCARIGFVGVNYSFEQFYQAVRRCWRFGQTREVECHVVTTDHESCVYASLSNKQDAFESMGEHMRRYVGGLN